MWIVGVGVALEGGGEGRARWWGLADAALRAAGARPEAPRIIASCNGAAEPWGAAFKLAEGPIISASCASGVHALALARERLEVDEEVVVLAVDIHAPANQRNFEAMRILDPDPRPWSPDNRGFPLGEAAVALRLRREGPGTPVAGPILGRDLAALLATLPAQPDLIIGQGTGPAAVDAVEEAAIRGAAPHAPLRSLIPTHGHALGASGLLGVAHACAEGGVTLVVGRALSGACVATLVGRAGAWPQPHAPRFGTPNAPPALHTPLLRQVAAEAPDRRPSAPPRRLEVWLDAPLEPPARAVFKGRLLPSVVPEITPGFLPALIAGRWGFDGPATCLVDGTAPAMRRAPEGTFVVRVEREGHVSWS